MDRRQFLARTSVAGLAALASRTAFAATLTDGGRLRRALGLPDLPPPFERAPLRMPPVRAVERSVTGARHAKMTSM